jgi:hypothetical protein
MSEMSRYEQIYRHQNFCLENIKIEVKSKQIHISISDIKLCRLIRAELVSRF